MTVAGRTGEGGWSRCPARSVAVKGGTPRGYPGSLVNECIICCHVRRTVAVISCQAVSEPNKLAGHAFISYVREDSHRVDQLQQALEAAGVPVWRDTSELWPGDEWRAVIRRAITDNALVFLACFSWNSLARKKSYQNEELNLAIGQLRLRRPEDPWLIPVRFDECDIPDIDIGGGRTLLSIQRADLFGGNSDEATNRLVQAVLRILGSHSGVVEHAEASLANTNAAAGTSQYSGADRTLELPDQVTGLGGRYEAMINVNECVWLLVNQIDPGLAVIVDLNLDEHITPLPLPHFDIVVKNLMQNSVDAMPEGGRLSVSTSIVLDDKLTTRYLQFVIQDTGRGIPPDRQGKLFELDSAAKREGGKRPGLWWVRNIVAQAVISGLGVAWVWERRSQSRRL